MSLTIRRKVCPENECTTTRVTAYCFLVRRRHALAVCGVGRGDRENEVLRALPIKVLRARPWNVRCRDGASITGGRPPELCSCAVGG